MGNSQSYPDISSRLLRFFSRSQRIQKINDVLCLYHLFFSLIGSSISLRSKLTNYENISFNRNSEN